MTRAGSRSRCCTSGASRCCSDFMRRALFLLAAGAGLAASPDAHAQGAPTHAGDAASYCRYVEGVADSLADLEQAPVLFGTGGIVSGADVSPGGSILGPTTR